jgi:protein arginine kinase activator
MLCQKCHQRPATVFLSQTVGQETSQAHLCEECAQEQNQFYSEFFPFNPFAEVTNFINGLLVFDQEQPNAPDMNFEKNEFETTEKQLQCPHCGYQWVTFRQNGRLGCPKCYEAFSRYLEPLISSIHGNVQYPEENPMDESKSVKDKKEDSAEDTPLKQLRTSLQKAIQQENFEEAAKIRDEIKKQGSQHGF